MKSKKWAIWCAFVGIIGGAFIMVAPLGLLAAGIGANGQMFDNIFILLLCTCVVVFGVALKSKLYYKGDDRVSTFVANTFFVAGVIGCTPIFIAFLLRIPFLGEGILWLVDSIFSGGEPFTIIFQAIWIVGILSIVSGIGYAVCLKNFKE
ncbi:MAG: hypothetical protein HXO94_05470 [Streptococcus sp.]|jgi:hypothetical protein|nr:hypothetical protein [Streptococcus sp.]